MKSKIAVMILVPPYLLAMAYFALRPAHIIPGARYAPASLGWANGAVHLQRGAALEDRRNTARMHKALTLTGQMSLVTCLQTEALTQSRPAIVVAYSRDCSRRNFSLGQEGDGLSFRLRTTDSDYNGKRYSLVVPHVFGTNGTQQLAVTCDGSKLRLFVDGKFRAASSDLRGSFANWGRDYALVLGDEPTGGFPWNGYLRFLAIYDRALTTNEVARFQQGQPPSGAILIHDFTDMIDTPGARREGLKPLSYRNLFNLADPYAFQLTDCLFNIIGFLPLGVFVYMLLPLRVEGRKMLAVILIPLFVGFTASGTIEYMQRYLDGRVPCVQDIISNVTGTLMGSLLAWLAFSTFKSRTMNGRNT